MKCEAYKISKAESNFSPHFPTHEGTASRNCREWIDELKDNYPVPINLEAPTEEYEYTPSKFSNEPYVEINGRKIGKINLCKYHAAKLLDIVVDWTVLLYNEG